MLWQISFKELEYLTDSKSRSKSLGLMRTITMNVSDETTEALARGDKNAAHFRGTLVWAKRHQASMVINGEADHINMKAVSANVEMQTVAACRTVVGEPEPIFRPVPECATADQRVALRNEG